MKHVTFPFKHNRLKRRAHYGLRRVAEAELDALPAAVAVDRQMPGGMELDRPLAASRA
jgi:hypothetical protein